MAAAGPTGLQAWLLKPIAQGKPPVVLLTVLPGTGRELREVGPGIMQPEAVWFLRRGWAVVIVLHRGVGRSGGSYSYSVPCGEANLERVGMEPAKDDEAAFDFLRNRSDIDMQRSIAFGQGEAGLATLAFGLEPPNGVLASINVSGEWPAFSMHPSFCKGRRVSTFAKLAGTNPPMLWVYRADYAKTASRLHEGFVAAGGRADLVTLPKTAVQAPDFFWGPPVEHFLQTLSLPFLPAFSEPMVYNIPPNVSFQTEVFQKSLFAFLRQGPYRALATSPTGAWAWTSGDLTPAIAAKHALIDCGVPSCTIVAKEPP